MVLVGGATTFAVLHGKDEQEAKAAEVEPAGEKFTEEEKSPVDSGEAEGAAKAKPEAKAKGPGGTLQLAADPSQLAFDKTTLASKPGKVTIDFDNPSALEHDVAIEQGGKQIAVSETIAKGKTSVTADLEPGTYTLPLHYPRPRRSRHGRHADRAIGGASRGLQSGSSGHALMCAPLVALPASPDLLASRTSVPSGGCLRITSPRSGAR